MSIDTTKAVYLSKLIDVLGQADRPVAAVLRSAGIGPRDLRNRDLLLPIANYLAAIEEAVSQCDMPDLGFRVGAKTKPLEHGVLGYALLSSPNLRESLQRYVRYQFLQGPLLTVTFSESGTTASLTASPLRGRWQLSPNALRYVVQEWLIGWNQWCQIIGRAGSFFEHVRLGYPSSGEEGFYESHLGCTVSFDNPETTAIFATHRLDLPLEYADDGIASLCAVQCERLLEVLNLRAGLVAEIHRRLASAPGQVPSMDKMAKSLHLGIRTLRRRLLEENTSYQQVITEFRVAMAKQYLAETSLPANEVAALVGYSDPANLYRIFQKAVGRTPQQYRDHPG